MLWITFIIGGILFGSICYWMGYGYGKDEGIIEGEGRQKERYIKTLDAYRANLSECQHDLAFRDSAIDAMRNGPIKDHNDYVGRYWSKLANHRGKDGFNA